MEQGLLGLVMNGMSSCQLLDIHTIQPPAMRGRDPPQCRLGLCEGDEERLFTRGRSFKQELETDGGLASSRAALDQVELTGRKTAGKDRV